jgi:hypothetical protein
MVAEEPAYVFEQEAIRMKNDSRTRYGTILYLTVLTQIPTHVQDVQSNYVVPIDRSAITSIRLTALQNNRVRGVGWSLSDLS